MFKNMIIILALLLSCIACSSSSPEGKTEAEVLYKEAEEHVKHNRNELAIEKLNIIKSQHPYSYYATYAELLLADILFKQENFIESAAAYLSFRELHPKHPRMSYVIWRIVESYYQQLPSSYDRDLSSSKEVIQYAEELIQRFPDSEFIPEAKARLQKVQAMLREQDLYVANFYFKTDVYFSARHRYLDIIEKYKEFPEIVDLGMVRIVISSLELKEYDACFRYIESYMNLVSEGQKEKILSFRQKCEDAKKEQK